MAGKIWMLLPLLGISLLQARNLFPNPGFELWNEKENTPSAPGWRWNVERRTDNVGDAAFSALERSTLHKRSGEASLHLRDENVGAINNVYRYWLFHDDLKPFRGKAVRFSAWVKQIRANEPGKVGIGVSSAGKDGKALHSNEFIPVKEETDFIRLTVFLKIPSDAEMLMLCFLCARNFGCSAEAYFDDVELEIISPEEVPGKKIQEGKMESLPCETFLLSFYPQPPSWSVRGTGSLQRRGNNALDFSFDRQKEKEPGRILWETEYLNRRYDFTTPENGKLCFCFDSDRRLDFKLKYRCAGVKDEKELLADEPRPIAGGYRYTVAFPDVPKNLERLQLEIPPGSRGTLTLLNSGFIASEGTKPPRYSAAPEVEAYADYYREKRVFSHDSHRRPKIKNGTFSKDGSYEFLLGPWVYNRIRPDWESPVSNRLKIDHIAYQEAPGRKVFDAMGFNAAQMSAAPCLPGQALFGLGVPRDFAVREKEFGELAKRYGDLYFVMDFAFSFDHQLRADNPKLWNRIEQKNEDWHAFVPVCPESPEGDQYYRNLMTGGTDIVLKNGYNVGIWELFNESSYACQCHWNIATFAKRMREKYGSIETANRVWNTRFASFEMLAREKQLHSYKGLWCEWAEFLGSRYAEILKKYTALVRSIDQRPDVYFTEQLAVSKLWDPFMDYRKIAEALDVLAFEGGWRYGHTRTAMRPGNEMEAVVFNGSSHWYVCDFYAALTRGGKPMINNEHYCWRSEYNKRVPSRRTDMITSLWNELMHGSSGNFTYVWDKRAWEWQDMPSAKANVIEPSYKSSSLLNPYNWPPEELIAFQQFREELEPFREKILAFPRTKPPTVAIYHSGVTAAMGRFADTQMRAKMQRWYSALLHAHYPLTFVFEEDLAKGLPETIQALVVPSADFERPETFRRLTELSARKKVVIMDRNAFRFDSHGNEFPEKIPTQMLSLDAGSDSSAGELRSILEQRRIRRYGTLTPMDGQGVLNGTDLQMIDRGDFKLIFLVGMFDIVHRKVLMKLFVDDPGEFYLTDVVRRRLLIPAQGERWSCEMLSRGVELVLPVQERVLLTLTRTRPEHVAPYRATEVKSEFDTVQSIDRKVLDEYEKRSMEQAGRESEGRIMRGVNVAACRPVNLANHVNMDFRDAVGDDRKGGGFDQGAKDFSRIPRGAITAAGIPFWILEPEKNHNRGLLVLAGRDRNYFPVKSEGIPIGEKCRVIYFLHTIGWGAQKGEVVMRYLVHYEDGSQVEIPIRTKLEIAPWMSAHAPEIPEHAKIALEFSNSEGAVNLQAFGWRNPFPERKIRSIDAVSTVGGGVPAVAAITIEKIER